ncbi:hypothetical protein RB195_019172 [Necator americanus]|uniref:Reverse transcriptase domain-containing protein n=1 Tax=Necator americanus TaxID=51031 RepID=A0ABR1CEY3_NECAM
MGGAHVSRLPGHKPRIKQGGAADSSLAAVLTSSDSVAPRGHHAVFYATQAHNGCEPGILFFEASVAKCDMEPVLLNSGTLHLPQVHQFLPPDDQVLVVDQFLKFVNSRYFESMNDGSSIANESNKTGPSRLLAHELVGKPLKLSPCEVPNHCHAPDRRTLYLFTTVQIYINIYVGVDKAIDRDDKVSEAEIGTVYGEEAILESTTPELRQAGILAHPAQPSFSTFIERPRYTYDEVSTICFHYEKAFDSVETNAILSALVDQSVDASYVRTLANCYDRCTTKIQLFYPLTIPIGKEVRQGDTIPKLFTAALQWIMKSLSWEESGIRVDGRFLSNLRFADYIVLFSRSANEAEAMLKGLDEAGNRALELSIFEKVGKSNFSKE